MPIIQYGEWLPDQPRFGNACITAKNVYPISTGYGPFPDTSSISDALAAPCVGVISFKEVDGTIQTFAGTATKLYQKNGSSWTDVSKNGGTYTASTFWRFAVYGDLLIATNGQDTPQKFDVTSSSEFADLGGSPPVHNFPIVIRDTLVALDCSSGDEIQWSAVNDAEEWGAACGGGSQPIVDGGPILGGTGGEFGVVLQEFGLTRMNFVGGDLRFTFDKIEGSVGAISADSIIQYKGHTFYLSEEGFQDFNGAESQNISDEKVTDTFFATVDYSNIDQVQGALDPRNSSVIWRYPNSGGGNDLIIYNYRLGRWSESDADVDCLHTEVTSTGERLSGFDSNDELVTFTGSDRTATVSTGDIQVAKDRSTFVRSVRGIVDAAHTVTVAKKTDLADTETVSANAVAANSNGKVSVRSHGRYHRFELSPTAAFTELVGIDVEAVPSGRKI